MEKIIRNNIFIVEKMSYRYVCLRIIFTDNKYNEIRRITLNAVYNSMLWETCNNNLREADNSMLRERVG